MTSDIDAAEAPFETIDGLFKAHVRLKPHAPALVDPADRRDWTSGAPKRLTYAEADRAVSALALRLQSTGLPAHSIVAYQLPNCVESVLTLLAILRAGFTPAPLPLLWRQADMAAALARAGAKALVTLDRLGAADCIETAMHAAAEAFSVRFVCAFGGRAEDGVVPLSDVFADTETIEPAPLPSHQHQPALVTFDVARAGITPVSRSHAQLIGGGRLVASAMGIGAGEAIFAGLALGSFPAIAATILPWLLSGGVLALYHPFSPGLLRKQIGAEGCTTAILPAPLVRPCGEARLFEDTAIRTVLGVWRAPERMWLNGVVAIEGVQIVDALAFGETGLLPLRRQADGAPATIPPGRHAAPGAGEPAFISVQRNAAGCIGLGGPLVPSPSVVDTGYPCQRDKESGGLSVSGPPAGIVTAGGYHFIMRELEDLVGGVDSDATIAALPDALSGYRLAGSCADRQAINEALTAIGTNPLVAGAFRERKRKPLRRPDAA